MDKVYLPDVLAIAPFYLEWAGIGGGVGNFLSYADWPEANGDFWLPQGVILNQDLSMVHPLDQKQITEYVSHPWYTYNMESVRQSRSRLFWVAALAVGGLVLNRFNVSLLALSPRPGTTYFPHWMEFAITVGIVSAGLLAFILANRYLPVTHHEAAAETS